LEAIERVKENLENLRPQMETLLEKREQIELISSQIQREVDGLEKEESVKGEEVHRLNIAVVRLNGEASNLDYDIERSRGLIQDIKTTIEQRSQEIESSERGIENYEKETDQNEKALVEDFSEKEVLEKGLGEREEAFQAMQEELRVREKGVREVRKDRDEASEKIHNLEMEISELEHQAKSLKERLWESYETDLEKVPSQDEIDLEEAEAEIEELKRKMKGLGAVNLTALREYEQEKERADFLSQQRDDLLSAEETLKETIQKINKTAHQRFDEVFTQVRKNFQETFRRFFQGGEADLRLAEGEDPLEAQIEIVARPAGKHFRDLDLLSGGERALTAISLLFALYLVKPSPFCILDEIDAPLDDANVERFTRVLSEYSEKTQFIIVTHNKMTMQVAQTLYGVTMEEEGVSKIVSVKFEDEEEKKRP
jgi:chromosome segregation protein